MIAAVGGHWDKATQGLADKGDAQDALHREDRDKVPDMACGMGRGMVHGTSMGDEKSSNQPETADLRGWGCR